ncbi:MAG: hypothetical protein M0Z49_10340 [Chloroflexi bacterium]|nr:hypothetical protein [Chloroflexota bacterium]
MRSRPPVPGPSFLKEEEVAVPAPPGEAPTVARVGMTKPTAMDDGWWLAVLFAHDDAGIMEAEEFAPRSGPPPVPPLFVMGPALAGALSGLILEEGGRQQIRLALPASADERRPWRQPLVLRMAIRWEPMRAATMRPTELAQAALHAFRRALVAAGSPS